MNVNKFYVCDDHYLLMFETKEVAQRAYVSGCQLSFKERKPAEKEKFKSMIWRTLISASPLTTVEDETKHWCWHWSTILDSKVTYITPKEPILVVEEDNNNMVCYWKVIAGEKIGWTFCRNIVELKELKKDEK